jgi:5-hydroxyisourate hydrolase
MSQITTHILDLSKGKPADGVAVFLEQKQDNQWLKIAEGNTNADGRIPGLLPQNTVLPPGEYKMTFETEAYFKRQDIATFYPGVEIRFYISHAEHYHVPLLLSPFGYSTYRGS